MDKTVPNVVFKTRVRDESVGGENPFRWQDRTTSELFGSKRVVVFALPGAFTPTCSSTHLPGYEKRYDDLNALGVDDVYCLSVNDAFVMFQWGKHQGVEKVKLLPDGNGEFTRKMGMLVEKSNLGFGMRSWRYSMIVNDEQVEKVFGQQSHGPVRGFRRGHHAGLSSYQVSPGWRSATSGSRQRRGREFGSLLLCHLVRQPAPPAAAGRGQRGASFPHQLRFDSKSRALSPRDIAK
jgi:peroxiredoxin